MYIHNHNISSISNFKRSILKRKIFKHPSTVHLFLGPNDTHTYIHTYIHTDRQTELKYYIRFYVLLKHVSVYFHKPP